MAAVSASPEVSNLNITAGQRSCYPMSTEITVSDVRQPM